MLSNVRSLSLIRRRLWRLNAPYGARCLLTVKFDYHRKTITRRYAPYGARCLLTREHGVLGNIGCVVLMRLMALGAF